MSGDKSLTVLKVLWPYLGYLKRAQANRVIKEVKLNPRLVKLKD